jgi:hypothetical protein
MKLYNKIPKRIAKKKIGWHWIKLNYARLLKPGDLVSTCEGVNRRVEKIEPDWQNWKNCFANTAKSYSNDFVYFKHGRFVIDFDVYSTGGVCSACHCCTFPTETREQIIEFFSTFYRDEENIPQNIGSTYIFAKMCVEEQGNQLFTELGEPTALYEEIKKEERKKWNERYGNIL